MTFKGIIYFQSLPMGFRLSLEFWYKTGVKADQNRININSITNRMLSNLINCWYISLS